MQSKISVWIGVIMGAGGACIYELGLQGAAIWVMLMGALIFGRAIG